MIHIQQLLIASLFSGLACGCSSNEEKGGGATNPPLADKVWYTNPVINIDTPDPSLIRTATGTFYLYGTGGNTSVYKSDDLVHWDYVGYAYPEELKPAWEPGAGIWASDINFINGQYVLYYSLSVWGGGNTCGIGVSTGSDPAGPFTDQGKLFRSNEIGVHNSIDPCYVEDEGVKYLFWGSFFGLYATELTDDGLALKDPTAKTEIAGNAYEGAMVMKRGEYYYLFASIGSCCEGLNSTYTTVVGRSTNVLGPYVNKAGERMLDNKHEVIIHKNDTFVGTGHNSEIVTDDAGKDWILYHAYQTANPDANRGVLLDRLYWTADGWPYVLGDSPAVKAEAPAIITHK
ncbi:MAG: family 43 glycosylhydrolase [Mediterranea sp.]|jgi:arabinan endo-1,5-alpha-L-arabinosidase|nr:family 43 glycosylhydrolase [Mediterranea sp.]